MIPTTLRQRPEYSSNKGPLPGWTPEIKAEFKEIGKLSRLAKSPHSPVTEAEARDSRINFQAHLTASRNQALHDMAVTATGNELWTIEKRLNPKKDSSTTPVLVTGRGAIAKTYTEKSVAFKEATFLQKEGKDPCPALFTREDWPRLVETELTSAMLAKVSEKKVPGVDEITDQLLQSAWKVDGFKDRYFSLVAECVRTGYHPHPWRIARVVYIKKKGPRDAHSPSSYRGISLINTMSKTLERIIERRLRHLLADRLPCNQYGNRRGYSTVCALLMLTNDIERASAINRGTSAVVLDVVGAFDNVQRRHLVSTMRKYYSLPPAACRWTWHFMEERKVRITVDGVDSQIFTIVSGIPQGSPASPLLFNIAIAPVYGLVNKAKVKMVGYADDLTLYVATPSLEENCRLLEHAARSAHDWLAKRGLTLDYGKKCSFAHFLKGAKWREKEVLCSLTLPNNDRKRPSPGFKLLGVHLDCGLTFADHHKNVLDKIAKASAIVKRLAQAHGGFPPESVRILYLACVRSITEYALPVWGQDVPAKVLKVAELVQNTVLRECLRAPRHTPLNVLSIEAHVPPLHKRWKHVQLRAIFRLFSNIHAQNPLVKLISASSDEARGPVIARMVDYGRDEVKSFEFCGPTRLRIDPNPWEQKPQWYRSCEPHDEEEKFTMAIITKTTDEMTKKLLAEWQAWSDQRKTGAYYLERAHKQKALSDKPDACRKFIWSQEPWIAKYLVAFRSNHYRDQSFKRDEQPESRPPCECGQCPDPRAKHILLECPLTTAIRAETLGTEDVTVDKLTSTRKGLEKTAEFLKAVQERLMVI